MSNNNLFQLVQHSFRVTVGAAATLMETVQDQQKREETLSELRSQFSQRTQEWEEKGASTEQEARQALENIWGQFEAKTSKGTKSQARPAEPTNVREQIRELTDEIVALRSELEQYKEEK